MAKPTAQISQVVWKNAGEFCPRLIVVDDLIPCISVVAHRQFSGNIL
jgi:hypothetical protein